MNKIRAERTVKAGDKSKELQSTKTLSDLSRLAGSELCMKGQLFNILWSAPPGKLVSSYVKTIFKELGGSSMHSVRRCLQCSRRHGRK